MGMLGGQHTAANLKVFNEFFCDLRIIGSPQELGEREFLVG